MSYLAETAHQEDPARYPADWALKHAELLRPDFARNIIDAWAYEVD